jgi:hypothetical protein
MNPQSAPSSSRDYQTLRPIRPTLTFPLLSSLALLHLNDRFYNPRNRRPPSLRIRPPPRRNALPIRAAPLVSAQTLSIRSHFLALYVDKYREVHLQYVSAYPTCPRNPKYPNTRLQAIATAAAAAPFRYIYCYTRQQLEGDMQKNKS